MSDELKYKDEFLTAFRGGEAHWGSELTIEMLAEYASEVATKIYNRGFKQGMNFNAESNLAMDTAFENLKKKGIE